MYFLVFVATLVVDTIPVVAPPAWTVLVLLLLLFHLNPWVVVFSIIMSRVGIDEMEKIKHCFPKEMQTLWLGWTATL